MLEPLLNALSEHRRELQVTAAGALGHPADPQEGAARLGGTLPAEQAHHIAVGAETLALRMERTCANALALAESWQAQPACGPLLSGPRLAPAARARRSSCSAAYGGLLSFELGGGVDCFDFLNRLEFVVSSSNLGDNRTLAIPVAHTISARWARSGVRLWALPTR